MLIADGAIERHQRTEELVAWQVSLTVSPHVKQAPDMHQLLGGRPTVEEAANVRRMARRARQKGRDG